MSKRTFGQGISKPQAQTSNVLETTNETEVKDQPKLLGKKR